MKKLYTLFILLLNVESHLQSTLTISASDPVVIAIQEISPTKLGMALKKRTLTVQAQAAYIEMVEEIIRFRKNIIKELLESETSPESRQFVNACSILGTLSISGSIVLVPLVFLLLEELAIKDKAQISKVIKKYSVIAGGLLLAGVGLIRMGSMPSDRCWVPLKQSYYDALTLKQMLKAARTA
jgi:hypothetical protein